MAASRTKSKAKKARTGVRTTGQTQRRSVSAPRSNGASRDLLARLKAGAVICAEGYVFELERRGYLQAGSFVPEVLFEHPEVVEQLHMDFVHAG